MKVCQAATELDSDQFAPRRLEMGVRLCHVLGDKMTNCSNINACYVVFRKCPLCSVHGLVY